MLPYFILILIAHIHIFSLRFAFTFAFAFAFCHSLTLRFVAFCLSPLPFFLLFAFLFLLLFFPLTSFLVFAVVFASLFVVFLALPSLLITAVSIEQDGNRQHAQQHDRRLDHVYDLAHHALLIPADCVREVAEKAFVHVLVRVLHISEGEAQVDARGGGGGAGKVAHLRKAAQPVDGKPAGEGANFRKKQHRVAARHSVTRVAARQAPSGLRGIGAVI
mmetsp:Transcript_5283/g.11788  ORF Transcript_5283/g.11788 Transcript_5283/m.11788 type:complete len:218 (+) Transcript_5283:1359-2012(+)